MLNLPPKLVFEVQNPRTSTLTANNPTMVLSPTPTPTPTPTPATPPPPPDTHKHVWVLEFVLRQPVEDWLANEIFLALPLPSPLPPSLKKTILIRRIASELSRRSVSERTLHSLELIEELDRLTNAVPPSASMRAAYCSVAVECIAKALREPGGDGDFADAVERICKRRLVDLDRSEATGLISASLRDWRKVMEKALESPADRGKLMKKDTQKKALDAVTAYVKCVTEAMGPPFLMLAVEAIAGMGKGMGLNEQRVAAAKGTDFMEVQPPSLLVDKPAGGMGKGMGLNEQRVAAAEGTDFMELETSANVATNYSDKPEEDMKADEQVASDKSELLTPAVSKVTEALKTSCADLLMAVEDPLPDAVATASVIVASKLGEVANVEKPQQSHNTVDGNEPVRDAEMGAEVVHAEGSGTNIVQSRDSGAVQFSSVMNPNPPDPKESEGNLDRVDVNEPVQAAGGGTDVIHKEGSSTSTEQNQYQFVPRPSLMDRNPTAHTYEWEDDSIDSPSENSTSPSKGLGLPSPRRRVVSPLKLPESKRFTRRRKIKKWSLLEEDTLRQAVEKHGSGNWKLILSCHTTIFEDRTEVDLKDKWRNMTK